MLVGYTRVSTQDQNLDLQKDALLNAGCERIFTDVIKCNKLFLVFLFTRKRHVSKKRVIL